MHHVTTLYCTIIRNTFCHYQLSYNHYSNTNYTFKGYTNFLLRTFQINSKDSRTAFRLLETKNVQKRLKFPLIT